MLHAAHPEAEPLYAYRPAAHGVQAVDPAAA
jgi:hypothetical protein